MNIDKDPTQQSSNDPAFAEINFFSPGSRINRLRYWAHSMLMIIPFYIVAGIGAVLALKVSGIFWGIVVIAYIAMLVFSFILIIQRLHDLDKSGWLSLLILVPFANIYLLVLLIFFAGTPGRNSYGLPTPPNKTWHWILALGFPVLFFILGILAAVGLPMYQQYFLGYQQEQIQDLEATDYDGLEGDSVEEEPTIADDEITDEEGEVVEGEGVESEGIEGDEGLESDETLEGDSVEEETTVEDATAVGSEETPVVK